MSINKVILLGNVGKDPDIKIFENGGKVASLTLATTKKGYTSKSGAVIPDKTEWHNLKCFSGLAEVCEKHIKKGSKIYVEGEILYREFEKDGIKRYATEILVGNLEMCDKPQTTASNSVSQPQHINSSQQTQTVPQPAVNRFEQPKYDNSPLPPQGIGGDDLPF